MSLAWCRLLLIGASRCQSPEVPRPHHHARSWVLRRSLFVMGYRNSPFATGADRGVGMERFVELLSGQHGLVGSQQGATPEVQGFRLTPGVVGSTVDLDSLSEVA